MDFRAHSEPGPCRRLADQLEQALGGADAVGLLADFPAALRMHDHADAGILGANIVHVLGQKALVDGAMPLPQDDASLTEPFRRDAAADHERVPDRALIERDAHSVRGVSAQMLVGKEENSFVALKCPFESCRSV